jgi:Tfp pilus assembly protein PilX
MHHLLRLARRRHEAPDEQGIALIVAMIVLMISVIVVAAVLQLATHTAQQSGFGRDRTAAVNAAEAGIQSELSTLSSGTCPSAAGSETALLNQSSPAASYKILAPVSCTTGAAVIAATGYVPNATNPVYETTMVAHVNRSQGAPVSGGTAGGYDFPDAVFTDGTLTATSGTLNLYGSGGDIANLTADGAINIGSSAFPGSLLGGAVSGENSVNVYAASIGGSVAGTSITLNGGTNGMTVSGAVGASSSLSKTNVTINGTTTSSGASLPQSRPIGTFSNNVSDIGTTLGVGSSATTLCPASATGWTAAFYDITTSCTTVGGYAPTSFSTTASNGVQVLVVQGSLTVTVPPTAVGGALYIVDAGGTGDSLTISDSGSTLPVFAFTDGSMSVSGTLAGQLAAHSITFTGASTSLTFRPPATPMPDIAFPTGYFAPTLTGSNAFVSTVSYEYQCPGTTAC